MSKNEQVSRGTQRRKTLKLGESDGQFPVVDLFAGPGGLSEGFAAATGVYGEPRFRSTVSIERDVFSHQTLMLRHFVNSFGLGEAPEDYYDFLAGKLTLNELYARHPEQHRNARSSALCISLGRESRHQVRKIIADKLRREKYWVLVGGPPCQAYSLVGRSRMKGQPDFDEDERHTLYLEFLRVVTDHRPPVFVMENVKGLLSAKIRGKSVIGRIVQDLQQPALALRGASRELQYRLYSLTLEGQVQGDVDPKAFLIRSEEYGVPQARHRMFIVGVRSDVKVKPTTLKALEPPTVSEAIGTLPAIRSKVSTTTDSFEAWTKELWGIARLNVRQRLNGSSFRDDIWRELSTTHLTSLTYPGATSSIYYSRKVPLHKTLRNIHDARLSVLTGHESRSHMPSDLRRYLYAAVFARFTERSPVLAEFPEALLPEHQNARAALTGKMFADRFRVQLAGRVSTTITSHISKDGHYFIHYDPRQCRSLTVREAARLQTFPDNYFFCGPRTSQYHQVGNAVPPQLARQIADIVADMLDRSKGAR